MIPLTASQREAIAARGNVIVVAGAGTGKTSTMVERVLALTRQGVSLENILMVTFTDAAAAEMRGRLREALRESASGLRLGSPPYEPAPSPLPGGEPATGAANEAPLLGEASGGFMGARRDKSSGKSHPEGTGEHLEKQLALLDAAHISTLHSFCLQLVREHFYELALDPEIMVLDEQQTRPLIRQTLDAIFERHYANETEAAKAVRSLVRMQGRGADDRIRALALKLHRYAQSLADPERWLKEQRALFREAEPDRWRDWFLRGFPNWRDRWLPVLESFADILGVRSCLQALRRVPAACTFAQASEAIRAVRVAEASQGNWPSGSKTRIRGQLKYFFADAEFLESLLPASGSDPLVEDWQIVRPPMIALLDLAQEFTTEFSQAKRALGGVDFADLEQFALRLLRDARTGEPTPIARDWRERLEFIFVDEYQDINGAQDAILAALSREGERANRFLVGDVKQSIYRFRLANPRIFRGYEEKWRQGTDHAHRISLTENFRSRASILDFVNSLFGCLLRVEVGGVGYEALQPDGTGDRNPLAREAISEPRVEFHLIARSEEEDLENESEDDEAKGREDLADLPATEREARLIALRLLELHRQGHPVWDKAEKKFRPVRWKDMAVLLRSPTGRAEAMAMEFSRVGVPLEAARSRFFQALEVSDWVCLLKLLDNPLQDIPLLAVLRSPIVGLSVEELGEIRAHNREPNFWMTLRRFHRETSRDRAAKTAASAWAKSDLFLRQFERWRELIRQASLSDCLETALAETHYEEILSVEPRGESRLANVRRLADLARQYDPYRRQGLFRFLRFVQAQEESETGLEPADSPMDNSVQLRSIHKSKGLEFPVVVVAGLGGNFNFQDLREDVLLDEEYGLCPKVAPPGGEQFYPTLPHWLARCRQRREILGEELRLLYVAMTRARDTLILTATASSKRDPRWLDGASQTLSSQEVLAANSPWNWLQAWLRQATREADWTGDRAGQSRLLRWTIYSETDSRLAIPTDHAAREFVPEPAMLEPSSTPRLSERMSWEYPFSAATEERAKTSVTQLRRRRAEDEEEAQPASFVRRSFFSRAAQRKGTLSAADVGIAHHLFLQFFDSSVEPTVDVFLREAERLVGIGLLTRAQGSALDFEALTAFWNSESGKRIRSIDASLVRRELPFTARFSPVVLKELGLPVSKELPKDEWVVAQGVVDLAVIQPQEIWLVDFKTDEVKASEIEAKVDQYRPQLRLYAQALGQIYRRPVTERWLHFLKLRQTVAISAAK